MCVHKSIYIQLIYVHMAKLWIYDLIYYSLLNVQYVIRSAYFTSNKHLCGHYVILDILMSMYMPLKYHYTFFILKYLIIEHIKVSGIFYAHSSMEIIIYFSIIHKQ